MRTLMFVVAIAAASGCTVDDPSADTGEVHQYAKVQNRLASNRLASNRLASNRLASNRLASNAISSTRLEALQETSQILSTAEGRDVYSYIISCALPAALTIEADVPGATDTSCVDGSDNCPNYVCTGGHCTFFGNLGLAPRWIDHKLGDTDRGWVSACMFARVNANNVAEAISARGRNDGLAVSAEEVGEFGLEEGAFFGNLFTEAPEGTPPDWNACRGEDKALQPTTGGLANRACADEDPAHPGLTYCSFKFAGDCRNFQSPVYACGSFDPVTGIYGNCHGTVNDERGKWPKKDPSYRQVITVYVSNL